MYSCNQIIFNQRRGTFATFVFQNLRMEYQTHILANGIRLIHMEVNNPVAHLGLIVNTGSRDELDHQHGLAHLIEHLVFKGTKKRKAYHILSRMEDVGGEINAYTTKEETCIYTTFFPQYYERSLELTSDIIFNSTFPEKEIIKEKEVVIDEINSYKDSPYELIYDEFEELIFRGNPIGRSILGEENTLKALTRDDILAFYNNHYHTDHMVISSVGNIKFNRLVKYVEKYFSDHPVKTEQSLRFPVNGYTKEYKTLQKDTYQAHCVMGNRAYHVKDDKRMALYLLNNLLGGPGLNSRLNLSLREKNGYAYNLDSSYTSYSDTGIISIYFGTDKKDIEKCIKLVLRELNDLKRKQLGTSQLQKAKRQLLGQIAISAENNESLMLTLGKSYFLFDKVDSLEETAAKIDAITSLQLLETANEIFNEPDISYLIYR